MTCVTPDIYVLSTASSTFLVSLNRRHFRASLPYLSTSIYIYIHTHASCITRHSLPCAVSTLLLISIVQIVNIEGNHSRRYFYVVTSLSLLNHRYSYYILLRGRLLSCYVEANHFRFVYYTVAVRQNTSVLPTLL